MSFYNSLRQALFLLSPEFSHDLTLKALFLAHQQGWLKYFAPAITPSPCAYWGLRFRHPVGLAAGLDKNGDCIDALGALGFSFIEVGTVTPRPQPGNPLPRLFRLPAQQAIINRMGFNNKGVDHLVENLKSRRYMGIVGVNIGKNKDTPMEKSIDDYLFCLERVYPHADYVTVNISSPNTPGLRDLQEGEAFSQLLLQLKERQAQLRQEHDVRVPLLLKVAPDLNQEAIERMAEQVLQAQWDGVIATNTTVARVDVENSPLAQEAGGLSGAPLLNLANQSLCHWSKALAGKIPVIGVGGILSGDDAASKIQQGADLVQLYSGFIYRGPALIKEAVEAIARIR